MSVPLLLLKPKATPSAVQGRITAVAEDGAKVGQWGGTECYLSRENGLGPCLVVTTVSNKKRVTLFPLVRLHRVLAFHVNTGKLTVMMPHERRRMVSLFIETTSDVEELKLMAAMLQDKHSWAQMERNVTKSGKRNAAGRGSAHMASGGDVDVHRRDSLLLHEGVDGVRDNLAFDAGMDPGDLDDGFDDDAYEEEARNAMAIAQAPATATAAAAAAGRGQSDHNARADPLALANAAATLDALSGGEHAVVPPPSEGDVLAPSTERRADVDLGFPSGQAATQAHVFPGNEARAVHTLASSSGVLSTHASLHVPSLLDTPQLTLVAETISQGTNVFITGPPGTGKTAFVLSLLRSLQECRANPQSALHDSPALSALSQRRIAVTATTGHAARFLGGATLAAFSGVPPHGSAQGVEAIVDRILTHRRHRDILHNWLTTDILVMDDINEVPAHVFTLLSEVGKRVRQAAFADGLAVSGVPEASWEPHHAHHEDAVRKLDTPFGGMQLVVLGDFLATPPPPSRAGEEVLSTFTSSAWAPCALQCVWFMPDASALLQLWQHGMPATEAEMAPRWEALHAYQTFLENLREGDYTVAVDDIVVTGVENYRRRSLAQLEAKRKRKLGATPGPAAWQPAVEPVVLVASEKEANAINARSLADALDRCQAAATAAEGKKHKHDTRAIPSSAASHAGLYHHFTSEDYAAQPGTDMDGEVNLPATLALCRGAQVMLLASPSDFIMRAGADGEEGTKTKKIKGMSAARGTVMDASPTPLQDLPFCPTYGSIGVVVGFQEALLNGDRTTSDPASPVVRFYAPLSFATSSAAAPGRAYVDVVVPPITLNVYEHAGCLHRLAVPSEQATGTLEMEEGSATPEKLVLSRRQVPLRLAFALPVATAALHNTPMLPAIQVRVDRAFFAEAGGATKGRTSDADGEGGEQESGRDEEGEGDGGVSDALVEGQWGLLLAALAKVPSADKLFLERFDRKLMKRALNEAAVDYYAALFPPSAEETQALAEKRAAEKAILDQRRKQRKAEKKKWLAEFKSKTLTVSSLSQKTQKRVRSDAGNGEKDGEDDVAFLTSQPFSSQAPDEPSQQRRKSEAGDTTTPSRPSGAAAADAATGGSPSPGTATSSFQDNSSEAEAHTSSLVKEAAPTSSSGDRTLGQPAASIAGDSFHLAMLTQDSMVSTTMTELMEASQVRSMVRGLLMDDDEDEA